MRIARSTRLPTLLVSLLFLVSGCGQDLTATEHVSKAKDYLDKGELRPAMIELSSAVQKDPSTVEGRWLLARVSVDMGEGPRAEKEIRKAMELGLNRASGQLTLVESLLVQGELDRLLQESSVPADGLSQADHAALLGLRGQAYIAKGQFDLAEQALNQGLQLKSDSMPVLIGMTALHALQRQFDTARQWVDKALKADPVSPDAWSALGDLEMAGKKLAEAEKAYTQAIKHRPMPYFEQIKRAQVRVMLNQFPEAAADIAALQDAGFKDHPYVNYVAGLNSFSQKKYTAAAAAFQASHTANPDFLPNRIYLATTQLQLGNTEQALSLAEKILADAPRSPTAKGLLGSVLISRADYDGAKSLLKELLTKSPNDSQALMMMSTVALREGDATQGLEYALKLASLQPDSPQARNTLLLARLMAGEALDKTLGEAGKQGTAGDAYTRDFALALAAFRDGKLKQALDRAQALQQRHPDQVDPPKLIAAVYLSSAQWDQARSALEKVLRIQPDEPSATRNLAKLEAIQGNPQRARTLLQTVVKKQPDDLDSARALAAIESQLGNLPAALQALEPALKRMPNNLELVSDMAQIQLKLGQADKVVDMTRRLGDAQFKSHPALLEMRGKAQLISGDLTGAASSFEKLTRLAPQSAPARFQYANILASRGDAAGAKRELDKAVKLDPRYLPARIGEIKVRVQFNELDPARKALQKLRQDFGDHADVLGIEGWFALGTGDFATAEHKLSAALKKKPDSELVLLAARAQWAQKKQEPALRTLRDWLKTHPKDVPVSMQLAGAYLDMGKESEAISAYEQVVKLAPKHVPALNNLAWLNRSKAPKQAMDYAQQAYQLAPKDPYVLDTLGMLVFESGDVNRASRMLAEAVDRAPGDVQVRLHYGQVLIKQKRLLDARKLLEPIAKGSPGSPAGKQALAMLATLPSSR